MMPASLPSYANRRGVFPSPARESAKADCSLLTIPFDARNFRLPPRSAFPSSRAWRPCPGRASKSFTSLRGSPSACAVTAFASGCSLFFSSEAARPSSSSASIPNGITSVTRGRPSVTVPVLSRAIICVRPAASSAAAVLYRMPFFAPTPLPTMMATGVASPRAQGQLMTSTEIPRAMANEKGLPAMSHPIRVRKANPMTAGTKIPDTLSAIRASGALVAAASDTVRMICASVVSSPTRVARHSI